jgi:hypothetical protein
MLDFSDPLASYIVQACVRVSTLAGNEFQPFVDVLLPTLLAHIAEEIKLEVSLQDTDTDGGQSRGEIENRRERGSREWLYFTVIAALLSSSAPSP